MASYHRVLETFGRAANDNDVQCDCDIHPWNILINGERWTGKIRLVGFIDVFFLISYTNNSRFEKGIIVYKDNEHIENLRKRIENARGPLTEDQAQSMPKVENHHFEEDSMSFRVQGEGHAIGLKSRYSLSDANGEGRARYPINDVKDKFHIEIRKDDGPQENRIKSALKKHDTVDLMVDNFTIGAISGSEITGHALSYALGGGLIQDSTRKFTEGLTSNHRTVTLTSTEH